MFSFLQRNRKFITDKLADLSNLIWITLIFGQFSSGQQFVMTPLFIGLFFSSIIYLAIYHLLKLWAYLPLPLILILAWLSFSAP